MNCDSPIYLKQGKGSLEYTPFPCGKCPPCKTRRVNQWVFRCMEETRVADTAFFVTLTYDTRFLPITANGFATLSKHDLQKYWKRLRKLCPESKIRYYAAGEYGSKNKRPHYHAIVFNVPDKEMLHSAWGMGSVVVGTVQSESVAYTMKYIDKAGSVPAHRRDDRLKEFSVMSKGLGSCYLDRRGVVDYHRSDVTRNYVTKMSGHKVPMPRYYRNKIFTEDERKQNVPAILDAMVAAENRRRLLYYHENPGLPFSFEEHNELEKHGRYHSFIKNQKNRDL